MASESGFIGMRSKLAGSNPVFQNSISMRGTTNVKISCDLSHAF